MFNPLFLTEEAAGLKYVTKNTLFYFGKYPSFEKKVRKHLKKIDFVLLDKSGLDYSKIQQTKMLVTCQRFGVLFLFGLVWQYSSVQTKYNKGRFKVMAIYLQQ